MKSRAGRSLWEAEVGERDGQSFHIKKNGKYGYPESASCGLLENKKSFSFPCWATCKGRSCFLFPEHCETVGFHGWEM